MLSAGHEQPKPICNQTKLYRYRACCLFWSPPKMSTFMVVSIFSFVFLTHWFTKTLTICSWADSILTFVIFLRANVTILECVRCRLFCLMCHPRRIFVSFSTHVSFSNYSRSWSRQRKFSFWEAWSEANRYKLTSGRKQRTHNFTN